MDSKLHMNSILTGCLDSFCLACESHLRSEWDVSNHIEKPVHKKNLDSCPYLEKFYGDQIRKVKKGYYCEFCNLLLPTAAMTSLHIKEPAHNNNKGVQLIKRVGSNIVISNDILITEQAWNGLIDDTCAVCNTEFHNQRLHVADQKHILSLIQRTVEFGVGNAVFRKIDDTSFHCLVCNMIFALNTIATHFNDEIHRNKVENCQTFFSSCLGPKEGINKTDKEKVNEKISSEIEKEEKKVQKNNKEITQPDNNVSSNNIKKETKKDEHKQEQNKVAIETMTNDTQTTKSKNSNEQINAVKHPKKTQKIDKNKIVNDQIDQQKTITGKNSTPKVDKNKIFDLVTEFQKNSVNINFETDTAFCKKCFESVDLDIEVIKKHIIEHKNKPIKKGANIVHSVDQSNSKTDVNSKDIESKEDKASVRTELKMDQNHNVTNDTKCKEKEEEIIKIDVTKKSAESIETNEQSNALSRYVPGDAKTELSTPKNAEKTKLTESLDINDPEVFANVNKLTYNKRNNNAFCRICNRRIPASIKNMKEHVYGSSHKTKVARVVEKEKIVPKKPMSKFIDIISRVENIFGTDDVILNDRICLTRMSFCMITEQNRLRCQACEVNLNGGEVSRHLNSYPHDQAMEKTPVVWSLSNEFVREVRPGLFHCGFCNLMVGVWENVARHLECSDHKESRRDAKNRLDEHMPSILAHREQREALIMRAFFQNFRNFF